MLGGGLKGGCVQMQFRLYIAAEDGIMHARCDYRSHVLVNFDIDYPACVIGLAALLTRGARVS